MNDNNTIAKSLIRILLFGILKPENKFKDEVIEEKQDYNVTFLIFVSY